MNYANEDSYKTRVGGTVSLLTTALILTILSIRVRELVDKSTQSETVQHKIVDLTNEPALSFGENDFEVFVGSTFPIPESIGRWRSTRNYKNYEKVFFL